MSDLDHHWLKYKMIHWDLPTAKLPSGFDYIHGTQVALTDIKTAYTFDVRVRLKIEDDNKKILFSSLLEVQFLVHYDELSEDILVDYMIESVELYLEEFDSKKKGTVLSNQAFGLTIDEEEFYRVAKDCIARLPS